MGRIIIPRIVVRPLLPPPPKLSVRIPDGWMRWEVGRYKERITSGPGGIGRGRVWHEEKAGEQSNLILNQFYDQLIPDPNVGLLRASWAAVVGTSSAPPDPNTIGFTGTVRWTRANPGGEIDDILNPSPGVYQVVRRKEFTEAQVGGLNLTEWGMSMGDSNANAPISTILNRLMTRELFRDGNGNPIVLTPDTDQRLRLIYTHEVIVGPFPAVPVSVNIQGIGTRTGQFGLTGRFYRSTVVANFAGINWDTGPRGGILLAHMFANGTTSIPGIEAGTNIYRYVSPSNQALPLTWNPNVNAISGTTPPYRKYPTDGEASNRQRQSSIIFNANEFNQVIRSVSMTTHSESAAAGAPTLNLVLDDGQEITKENTHKLLIAFWQITWGP